jgi:hypothetical protein
MQTEALNKESLIQRITDLTVLNRLVETIWVDSSQGQIETTNVVKEGDDVKNLIDIINFKLKSHRLIVKNRKGDNIVISDLPRPKTISKNKPVCICASTDVNKVFISELKSFKNIQKRNFKYFNQSILKRLINPNKDSDLVKCIMDYGSDCSWIIVPTFINQILSDSEWFDSKHEISESLIYHAGHLGDLSVYVNPDEEESTVYFGNYDSITIIINKNIQLEEYKSLSYDNSDMIMVVDYLFIERGLTKYLTFS